jgi:hypothetical protein
MLEIYLNAAPSIAVFELLSTLIWIGWAFWPHGHWRQ